MGEAAEQLNATEPTCDGPGASAEAPTAHAAAWEFSAHGDVESDFTSFRAQLDEICMFLHSKL